MVSNATNLNTLPILNSKDEQFHRQRWSKRKFSIYCKNNKLLPFQLITVDSTSTITFFNLYDENDNLIENILSKMSLSWTFDTGYCVMVYKGTEDFTNNYKLPVGYHYCTFGNNSYSYTTEMFYSMEDVSDLISLEFWDKKDLDLDFGRVIFDGSFRFQSYLFGKISRPEYVYLEEIIERDGYEFPVSQVSYKKYKFQFTSNEVQMDTLRIARQSDYCAINYNGILYKVHAILMTINNWTDKGICLVDVEFKTNSVVKKLGVTTQLKGDFSDDYSNDF